jgi:cytochrome c peroxidase
MIEAIISSRTTYRPPVPSIRAIKFVLSLIVVMMGVDAYYTRPGSSAAPVPSRENLKPGAELDAKHDGILREIEGHGLRLHGADRQEAALGALRFFLPFPNSNGRSCATCHRVEDNFGLTPATVEARYQSLQARRRRDPNADDPLFRSIDADDFDQDFTTLRTKALVRVVLPLPLNVKLADDPSATTVAVWRSVPTVVNTAVTAPYQFDGRLVVLEDQALSALRAHSEITGDPTSKALSQIASFQRSLFTSKGVWELAMALKAGATPPDPEPPLNDLEKQGKTTFTQFCASCHGGPTLTVNSDARFLPVPARGPAPGAQAFVNISVQTPRPAVPFFDGLPTAGLPTRTYIVTLPNGATQTVVTSDPGRGLITGDIREFGRFDVPTLFGVSKTAPYFHDNSAATLEQVIDHYQALFKFLKFADENQGLFAPAGANGQGCNQGDCGFSPIPEPLIPGLLAYLRKI